MVPSLYRGDSQLRIAQVIFLHCVMNIEQFRHSIYHSIWLFPVMAVGNILRTVVRNRLEEG